MTPGAPTALLVVYDAMCAFCIRCRRWLEGQPTWVPVDFLPAHWQHARRLAGHLPIGDDLVVLGSDGSAWVGDEAFLMCLWATRRHRGWALRLAAGGNRHLSRLAFRALSSGRRLLGPADAEACASEACGTP